MLVQVNGGACRMNMRLPTRSAPLEAAAGYGRARYLKLRKRTSPVPVASKTGRRLWKPPATLWW